MDNKWIYGGERETSATSYIATYGESKLRCLAIHLDAATRKLWPRGYSLVTVREIPNRSYTFCPNMNLDLINHQLLLGDVFLQSKTPNHQD